MDLINLKESFIPSCFEGRGWEKLIGDLQGVCEPLIREFYVNAILRNNYLDCWVRGHEFTLNVGDINGILGHGEVDHEDLYPVRNLTTINNARVIFLIVLHERTYIDIGAHAYSIIAEATRTTSRAKLVLPSLIMRILHEKGVETSQDISLMSVPPSINSQTILRSRVHLPVDEQANEPKQASPIDPKTELEEQQPSPRRGGGQGRSGASSVPPDTFQIILERIDGLRDVQTEHSTNLISIQD